MHRRTFSRIAPKRAKFFFYLLLVVSAYLAWRLVEVQTIRGPLYAKEALEQRSDIVEVFARRGSILDRDANVLVRSLPSESVYAIPHDLLDPHFAIVRLQSVLGRIDPGVRRLMADRHLRFVWIVRKISPEVADRVQALDLPGIQTLEEDTGRRVDLAGRSASTLLGFVGIDENGLAGLEYTFDDLLRGSSGRMTMEADEFGRPIPFGRERIVRPAKPGLSLELTIDSYLQYVAESAIAAQVKMYHARSASAIVMDPRTGEVLALANVPSYDPNAYWKFSADQRRDRAIEDAYEPGSTFKLVTAAAALQSGKVTTGSRFACRDTIEVGGRTIHNAEDGFLAGTGSSETLEDVVAYSHNVGAAEVGLTIGGKTFFEMEDRAGFGRPSQIGLAGENPGIVPPPAQWSGSSLATMAFGQGVSVTPIAMARFYAAIANGGLLMRPRVLRAILDAQGNPIYAYPTQIERRIMSRRVAATLRRFLRSVVLRGTGNPTAQIPGYTTAGKTGTAQMVENGEYEPGAYVASFIGMVPYERPRYLIFVKVERPVGAIYGSVVAAPAFAAIAKAAMLHAGVLPAEPPAPPRLVRSKTAAKR